MENKPWLLTYECVNCGFKAWSLREIARCHKCGAVVVCTYPSQEQETEENRKKA